MISEGFCDTMFDPFADYSFAEFNVHDSWSGDRIDGFATITDQLYQPNGCWKRKASHNWITENIQQWMFNEVTNNNTNYEDTSVQNILGIANDFGEVYLENFVKLPEFSEDRLNNQKENANITNNQLNCLTNETTFSTESLQDYSEQSSSRLSWSSTESSAFEQPPRKRPGRPRSSHTLQRKPEKRMGKLWEFLRNLLQDDKTCPSLIKWDNYNEGTFKFVQSEKVAKLWGDRKKNDKMNYEKLSRAMRYYYRSKVLLPVAGKRLVYKFGPHATGWKTANPILDTHTEL